MAKRKKISANPLRVTLGASGLRVSPICFGTWQLSPRFWGKVPQQPIVKAVQRAFDLGINFFDTADAYGEGLSERVLGQALKPLPRAELVIATKVYWNFTNPKARYGDLSRAHILAGCEASLKRMKLDYIDLYQCHAHDPLTDPAETADALETLRRQGKIRAFGVSNWTVEQMRTGALFGQYTTCQPPYSLIRRDIENDILPYCRAQHIGTLVYSPLQRGLLTGKYTGTETFADARANSADFQGERFKLICDRVAALKPIARRHNLTITQLVLAATLMHPAITTVITGIKDSSQIEESVGAMGVTLPVEDWHEVRGLLSIPKA